jgi:hypothetical protein
MAGTDIENDMMKQGARRMAEDIDREVLWGMLIGLGWKRHLLDRLKDNNHAVDISYWLDENCRGAYERNGRDFIFEDERDYLMFVLTWA